MKWSETNSHEYTFEHFMVEFERNYVSQNEYFMRRSIFEENLRKVNEINSRSDLTWRAAVNDFADKLESEKESQRGFKRVSELVTPKARNLQGTPYSAKDYPASLDWRTKNVLNAPKNQRACGSCWAFAAVAVLESRYAIKSGKLESFSEQQLVDCAPNPHKCGGTGGCEGSDQPLAFDYMRAIGGIALETEYEYHAHDETCKDSTVNKVETGVAGFNLVEPNSVDALMEAIQSGPVTISVDATTWSAYGKGVFQSSDCGAEINHAVTLVGYGEEDGQKYWIVRNSWGSSWGEQGHIRLARESNQREVRCFVDLNPSVGSACENGPVQTYVCGTCGLYASTSYPVFK